MDVPPDFKGRGCDLAEASFRASGPVGLRLRLAP